jgi:hypothetical protein
LFLAAKKQYLTGASKCNFEAKLFLCIFAVQ